MIKNERNPEYTHGLVGSAFDFFSIGESSNPSGSKTFFVFYFFIFKSLKVEKKLNFFSDGHRANGLPGCQNHQRHLLSERLLGHWPEWKTRKFH